MLDVPLSDREVEQLKASAAEVKSVQASLGL